MYIGHSATFCVEVIRTSLIRTRHERVAFDERKVVVIKFSFILSFLPGCALLHIALDLSPIDI